MVEGFSGFIKYASVSKLIMKQFLLGEALLCMEWAQVTSTELHGKAEGPPLHLCLHE
jgi:hypothetical protein